MAKEKQTSEEINKSEEINTPEVSGKVVAEPAAEENAQEEKEEAQEPAIASEKAVDTANTEAAEAMTEEEHENEAHEEEEEDHEEQNDYSQWNKEQLTTLAEKLAKEENVVKAEKMIREAKPFFDEIFESEKAQALQRFIADGGTEEDFGYKPDELDNRFDAAFKLIRDKKHEFVSKKEKEKEKNLNQKNAVLEKLRHLVDGEESTTSLNALKEIQKEWKEIGNVPPAHVKTLWANYNALIQRFYDNRSIYFELKELDRKKNLERKLELCERAEKLLAESNIRSAIRELNELHEEYKHLGPVPKEEQENLWKRFKAASDQIYSKRKEFVDTLKTELHDNQIKKQALVDQLVPFLDFDSDKIADWNTKTKEILEIQKEWEKIGGLPRESAKEINKGFWGAFKQFFNNKNAFFKKLEAHRDENLKRKEELIQRALDLKESTEWDKTANELKKLQQEWKEIGPVPEKVRNDVYNRFKAACDEFFKNKRESNKEQDKEFTENLKKKKAICEAIKALNPASEEDVEKYYALLDDFAQIGFVPRSDMKTIQKLYKEAVDAFVNNKALEDDQAQELKLASQIQNIKGNPNADRKLYQKEQSLKKQINHLENDIAVWKNNLEFFADSKKASKFKEEFNQKIEKAKEELKALKKQLRMLKNM